MLKLKEGLFAIVAKGEVNNSNIGKIVYLYKHLGVFENDVYGAYNDAWHVVCPDGLNVPSGTHDEGVIEGDRLIAINSKLIKVQSKE